MTSNEKALKLVQECLDDWHYAATRVVDIMTRLEKVKELLKEHETEWEHLWDAPDGTFKGRCKKCGFVHFFIEGHDTQYKFCPECGRAAKWTEPTAGTNKIPLKW